MNVAQLDAIVRKHTDFPNFDTMVGTYAERQVHTACWLPDAKSDADRAELSTLADSLRELAIQVVPSISTKPEQTEADNPIPEKPFTARDAAEEIWKNQDLSARSGFGLESLELDDCDAYKEIIASIVAIIEKVNAPHS